jgi:hypothetical protein
MKRLVLIVCIFAVILAGSTQAGVYYFQPPISNLGNLDHSLTYTWGINWTHSNERITDAVLTFHNIWNWKSEPNNLYTNLLDDPRIGMTMKFDNQASGNAFAGQGVLVGNWTDNVGGHSRGFDLTYRFSDLGLVSTLNNFAANGRFGFGFDPDCHYNNSGVTLKVTTGTASVPEPATLALFGLGLFGFGLVRRRK